MKIHVNKVPAEGLKERATYDPTVMDMDRLDVRLTDPFDVEAFVTVAQRQLVVKVDIRVPADLLCARCLKEFPTTLTTDAFLTYTVHPTQVVDITDDVRQEILLAYPVIALCRPDCRGLCRTCGQDLNSQSCSHAEPVKEE